MSSFAAMELSRLRTFAARRLSNPHGPKLRDFVGVLDLEKALFDRPLVPWEMSVGYGTSPWGTLSDEQRLALNQWTYAMMYFRIGDGERFVIIANTVVADVLEPEEPELAALLRLETHEELDHLAAFGKVFEALAAHHGFGPVRMPVKPLRPLVVSAPFVRFLARTFGPDFVATYYLGRGLVNHMGKAFETRVAAMRDGSPALAKLSMLHTVDENRHMAVSRMMAACAFELLHAQRRRGPLFEALSRVMQQSVVRHTFSDRLTTGQERAMSHLVVPRMKAFAGVDRVMLHATIDAHFAGLSGIERAKNEYMPPFNQRLLERACLSPADKRRWFELINDLQRNLRFFPGGWQPGAGSDGADLEGQTGCAALEG